MNKNRSAAITFFTTPLRLQNDTVYFILINCLDIFMTYILLRFGGMEVNPVANFFLHRWNFSGLVAFKMAIVAFVLLLAHVVARHNERKGRILLGTGSAIVLIVVVYSAWMFLTKILLTGDVPALDI